MWHYEYKEEIVCKQPNDMRAGMYLVYYADTIDYLVNEPGWVVNNGAIDESNYIIDHWDMRLVSDDGELVYIPNARTAMKIETERAILDMETDCY